MHALVDGVSVTVSDLETDLVRLREHGCAVARQCWQKLAVVSGHVSDERKANKQESEDEDSSFLSSHSEDSTVKEVEPTPPETTTDTEPSLNERSGEVAAVQSVGDPEAATKPSDIVHREIMNKTNPGLLRSSSFTPTGNSTKALSYSSVQRTYSTNALVRDYRTLTQPLSHDHESSSSSDEELMDPAGSSETENASPKDSQPVTLESLAAAATTEAAMRTAKLFPMSATMQCPHCLRRIKRQELSEHLQVCELHKVACRCTHSNSLPHN